jgi:ComF family protein
MILIDLLFPRRCPVCDRPVKPFGEKICTDCIPQMPVLSGPVCMKCGRKILREGAYCRDCLERPHAFRRGRSVYEYEGAARSIYRFKYSGRQEYAGYYGQVTARLLKDFIRDVKPDALVPVPLHPKRYAKRGYNQAECFARALSKETGIPVRSGYLRRTRNTLPMKNLQGSERQNNVKRAFIVPRNDVKLKTIIIIDDIYTTGTTVDEATRALRAAGVKDVYFITLAGGAGI